MNLWLTLGGRKAQSIGHLIVLLLQFSDSFLGVGQFDGHRRVVAAAQIAAFGFHKLLLLFQHQLERVEPLQFHHALLFVLLDNQSSNNSLIE